MSRCGGLLGWPVGRAIGLDGSRPTPLDQPSRRMNTTQGEATEARPAPKAPPLSSLKMPPGNRRARHESVRTYHRPPASLLRKCNFHFPPRPTSSIRFAMATPIRLAGAPPARPPQPLSPPPPPPPHHDTTLTLSLALPPPPFVCAISPRPAPRPPDGVVVAQVRSSSLTEDTPPSPCSECGKQFPSWKALFGHMRCHPERQWRGIKKPPHFRHQAVVAAAADLHFTEQERETATSLLMLRQGEPAGKGKKSVLGASPPSAKAICGASTSASLPPPSARCDDHKCSVCARGFATGQALGGHKRCHWEKTACVEGTIAVATSSASPTSSSQAAPATTLDLNLPPPGMPPLPKKWKRDQGGSLDATLDLKLGF